MDAWEACCACGGGDDSVGCPGGPTTTTTTSTTTTTTVTTTTTATTTTATTTSITTSVTTTTTCFDRLLKDGQLWHDSDASGDFTCATYAKHSFLCGPLAEEFMFEGLSANVACCACGGGYGSLVTTTATTSLTQTTVDSCGSVICNERPNDCHQQQGTCSGGQCLYAFRKSGSQCQEEGLCDGRGNCIPASTTVTTVTPTTISCSRGSWLDRSSNICVLCTPVENGAFLAILSCNSAQTTRISGCRMGYELIQGGLNESDSCIKIRTTTAPTTMTTVITACEQLRCPADCNFGIPRGQPDPTTGLICGWNARRSICVENGFTNQQEGALPCPP